MLCPREGCFCANAHPINLQAIQLIMPQFGEDFFGEELKDFMQMVKAIGLFPVVVQ